MRFKCWSIGDLLPDFHTWRRVFFLWPHQCEDTGDCHWLEMGWKRAEYLFGYDSGYNEWHYRHRRP